MKRAAWAIAAISIAAAFVAMLVFLVGTIRVRWPFFGEAETVFEAARIRAGLPLFVDPLIGAREYGAPYSRYYVTYPPVFTVLVSLLPSSVALVGSRVLSCLAWFGGLGYLIVTARKECRPNAIASALFVAGIWIIANFAGTGRPDAAACGLAAFGLGRALRRGRIDLLSTVLLVLAPWTKPSLLGLPAGAFLGEAIATRKIGGIFRAIAVCAIVAAILGIASGGQVFEHSFRSMAQPFTLATWLENVPSRAPFFVPLLLVAGWIAWRRRHEPTPMIALGALSVASVWILFSLAKTGAAANYWMEPCIAAVALLAQVEGPYRFGKSGLAAATLTAASVLYADVAAIDGSVSRLTRYRREAVFLATVRDRCGAGPNDVIASDVSGLELLLDGRIVEPAYQMTFLALAGRYPVEVWLRDLEMPNVRCFVRTSDLLDALPPIARYISSSFVPVAREGDMVLLRRVP